MADISLVIEYNSGPIIIPFREILGLDNFTVNYDNKEELADALKQILGLKINETVNGAYIQYIVKGKVSILPIKYSSDDFDLNDLVEVYKNYYKDDHMRIRTTEDGIKFVKHDTISDFMHNVRDVNNIDIDKAVTSFFSGSYKKYRDAYFTVKKYGYKVKLREFSKDTNLSKYDVEDEYFQSLKREASLGRKSHDRVLEELSLRDIEDLKKEFPGLFDGTQKKEKVNINNERLVLQALTGINIDELEQRYGRGR